MTDEQPPAKPRPKNWKASNEPGRMFKKSPYKPEDMFQYYCALPAHDRSILRAWQNAKADGIDISQSLFQRWAKKYDWPRRLGEVPPQFKIDPLTILKDLQNEAAHMTPEVVKGMQHRLAIKIANEIDRLQIENTTELERAVKVLSDMDEIHHRHRGIATKDKVSSANGSNGNGHQSVINYDSLSKKPR